MNEIVWWSRLAVWTGAVVLLAQSVSGQSTNVVTALAVVLLMGGMLGFLGGLVLPALPTRKVGVQSNEEPQPPEKTAVPSQTSRQSPPVSDGRTPAPVSPPQTKAGPGTNARVETLEVRQGDAAYGALCPQCEQPVLEGQIIATCPLCETRQHANCWTNNRFRCGVAGCAGRGSLEAPQEREPAQGRSGGE